MLAYHPKSRQFFCTLPLMATHAGASKLVGIIGLTLVAGGVVATPCLAQTPPAQQGASTASKGENILSRRVSVDAEQANLAGVLKTLMESVGADYTLAPELRRVTVTAHLISLPLHIVLDTVLKAASVPATYQVENGVYFFVLRLDTSPLPDNSPLSDSSRNEVPTTAPSTGPIRRVRVNYIDASDLARLLGGMAIKIDGQSYGVVNPNTSSLFGPRGAGATAGANGNNLQGSLFDGSLIMIGNAGAGFP